MGIKLNILTPEGAMISATLATNGQIVGLGIDKTDPPATMAGQASLGFVRNPQNSGYFYHNEWQSNGSLRYFVHAQPHDQPHAISSMMNSTLFCMENDGFRHATIDLNGNFLRQSNYSPETAVGMIYGGLKTYARSHLSHTTEPLEITLDLGAHASVLFGMLMADAIDQGQAGTTETLASIAGLPIQPLAHKLFDKKEGLTRNSPTMYTFLSVIDGVVYCDPITARMLRGARGTHGSDEATGGNLVADLQRAGKRPAAPVAESKGKNTYPASVVDAFNMRQWQILLSKVCKGHMTHYAEITIGNRAVDALAHWLAPQVGMERTALQRLMDETFQGSVEADLHFDDNGFIVGAAINRNSTNSPRGTTYEIGDTKTPLVARGIWLADLSRSNSSLKFSPVNYSWPGAKGRAYEAFMRWFNRPEYETVRRDTISFQYFKEAMNSRPSVAMRMAAVDAILGGNPQLRKYVVDRFCEITLHIPGAFDRCHQEISDAIRSGKDPTPAFYFVALYIERCLRDVVGDDIVNQAIIQQL